MRTASGYLGSILDGKHIEMQLNDFLNNSDAEPKISCGQVREVVSLSEEATLSRQASEQLLSDRHGTDTPTLDGSERN